MAAREFGIQHETQSDPVFATISVDVAKISKATLEAQLAGGAGTGTRRRGDRIGDVEPGQDSRARTYGTGVAK